MFKVSVLIFSQLSSAQQVDQRALPGDQAALVRPGERSGHAAAAGHGEMLAGAVQRREREQVRLKLAPAKPAPTRSSTRTTDVSR